MFYVIYEVQTGRIVSRGFSSAIQVPDWGPGYDVDWFRTESNGNPEDHPVPEDTRRNLETTEYEYLEELPLSTDRREFKADGVDTLEFTGLPVPCTVYVGPDRLIVEDGSLVLTADTPAEYEVRFDAWPYLPTTITVEAVQ